MTLEITMYSNCEFSANPFVGVGGSRRMADVPTSLIGANGIAGREKNHYWKKIVIAGMKMYCAHNDPIHPENQ